MAVTRAQKVEQLQELTQKFKNAQSVMFAHYIGMTVKDVSEFRQKLREGKAEMKVAKKTLIRLAAKEVGLPDIGEDTLDGPITCIFSFEDPLSGAQIAFKFAKDHEQVNLVGGFFDGKVLSKAEATEMAKMPSRQVLLATFMGMVQSPLRSFASICSSPMSGFARALSQLADKGGLSGAPAAPVEVAAAPAPEEAPAPVEASAAPEAPAPEAPAEPTPETQS